MKHKKTVIVTAVIIAAALIGGVTAVYLLYKQKPAFESNQALPNNTIAYYTINPNPDLYTKTLLLTNQLTTGYKPTGENIAGIDTKPYLDQIASDYTQAWTGNTAQEPQPVLIFKSKNPQKTTQTAQQNNQTAQEQNNLIYITTKTNTLDLTQTTQGKQPWTKTTLANGQLNLNQWKKQIQKQTQAPAGFWNQLYTQLGTQTTGKINIDISIQNNQYTAKIVANNLTADKKPILGPPANLQTIETFNQNNSLTLAIANPQNDLKNNPLTETLAQLTGLQPDTLQQTLEGAAYFTVKNSDGILLAETNQPQKTEQALNNLITNYLQPNWPDQTFQTKQTPQGAAILGGTNTDTLLGEPADNIKKLDKTNTTLIAYLNKESAYNQWKQPWMNLGNYTLNITTQPDPKNWKATITLEQTN